MEETINNTIYGKKCSSFKELEDAADEHDFSLTPDERLDLTQFLREQYYKIKGINPQRMDRTYAKKVTKEDLLNEI